MAVDSQGNIYVAGSTDSDKFPATRNAAQTQLRGEINAFVLKLDTSGALVYSTFLGGSVSDGAAAIQVDSAGSAYLVGDTSSPDFPGTPPLPRCTPVCSARSRVFVAKIDPAGGGLVYAFILAGTYADFGKAIAVDSAGNAFLTGITGSKDFPTTTGAFQTVLKGSFDAFVSKIDPSGTRLVYSTLLGGGQGQTAAALPPSASPYDNAGSAIAVDQVGDVYVAGTTNSSAFPITPGAFKQHSRGGNGFVAKINPAGSTLLYSTYFGGSDSETVDSLALDGAGRVFLTGQTHSRDFPVTSTAPQPTGNFLGADQYKAYLEVLTPNGTDLVFGTYIGGGGLEEGYGVAVDSTDSATVVGVTRSADFPVTPGAFQSAPIRPGIQTGFIEQLHLGSLAPVLSRVLNAASFGAGPFSSATIVSLFGSGLGPSVGVASTLDVSGKVSTRLSGTQVLFDGQPIPLLYAGDGQINAVLPVDISGSSGHQIAVSNNGVSSNTLTVAMTALSPALFTSGSSGTGAAVALNYNEQNGAVTVNGSATPAAKGSIVILYATGCGATDPPWIDGALTSSPLPSVDAGVSVTFGGRAGQVLYSGAAPQEVTGVVQINVRIPNAVASGSSVPINLMVGGVSAQSGVTVAIQ